MTPAARVQTAIEVLDQVLDGASAEQTLTRWARRARYAGSKDRAAVRDLVFQALRCRNSYAALGGALSGRGLMLGHTRDHDTDPRQIFTGAPYAPAALTPAEQASGRQPESAENHDLPDWIWDHFIASLGPDEARQAAQHLKRRAPIVCRVNQLKCTVEQAQKALLQDGIECTGVNGVETALLITSNERKLARSDAYLSGAIELQDASSQSAMARLEIPEGARVLDYCAGGGGKTLALAALHDAHWHVHDANPKRLSDLPKRAARAGVSVMYLTTEQLAQAAPFDLVLCDVPCSGSGTWRRAPEAKWKFQPSNLTDLVDLQRHILRSAQSLVDGGGCLAYTTCSVLVDENDRQAEWFCDQFQNFNNTLSRKWAISAVSDGFYLACFRKS